VLIGRLQGYTRILIGRYRRTPPVRWLCQAGAFLESAYSNEGSHIKHNGELNLIRRGAGAHFKVVFDVGANDGEWTAPVVKIWPACHVHAFEAVAPTHAKLLENVRRMGIEDRVTTHCAGLSDHDGAGEIFYYPDHPEVSADRRHQHVSWAVQSIPCTFVTGDAYIAQAGIENIDFLKVDVEGTEYKVLQGFSNALANGRVQCIQFEYGPYAIDTKFLLVDYYALLGERYWIGKVYPTHVEFREYDWLKEDFRISNFCAVLKTRPDLRRMLEG
jgi:FkbM family methyltransferase